MNESPAPLTNRPLGGTGVLRSTAETAPHLNQVVGPRLNLTQDRNRTPRRLSDDLGQLKANCNQLDQLGRYEADSNELGRFNLDLEPREN